MTKEVYNKLKKEIWIYAATFTSLIAAILFQKGIVYIASESVSKTIALGFFSITYFLLLLIAKRLREKDIHGIQAMAWSLYTVMPLMLSNPYEVKLWFSILRTLIVVGAVFSFVDGAIRFLLSLIYIWQKNNKSDERDLLGSVESVIAVITSIIAIVISLHEL